MVTSSEKPNKKLNTSSIKDLSIKESKVLTASKAVELRGTQSPNISIKTRNMPYGLNHRKSVEDLVSSGNLKVFNPLTNYNSKRSPLKDKLSGEKMHVKKVASPTYYTCK